MDCRLFYEALVSRTKPMTDGFTYNAILPNGLMRQDHSFLSPVREDVAGVSLSQVHQTLSPPTFLSTANEWERQMWRTLNENKVDLEYQVERHWSVSKIEPVMCPNLEEAFRQALLMHFHIVLTTFQFNCSKEVFRNTKSDSKFAILNRLF